MSVLLQTQQANLEDVFKFCQLNFPGFTKVNSNNKEVEFTFAQYTDKKGKITYVPPNGNNHKMLIIDLPTHERYIRVEICIIQQEKGVKIRSTTKSEVICQRVPEPFFKFYYHILHEYFFYKGKTGL